MADEPNFDISKGQGILATKRTDFQKHIDGQDFFQEAESVKLDPAIDIGGDKTNVREAIEALNGIIVSGAPDASATTKGILRLSNDLSGTALSPQVVGLRSRPITNAVPSTGNSLVWNGSQWVYQTISGTFTPGDDLTGSATLQQVIGLTGSAGIVDITADNLLFNNSNSDVEIGQESVSGAGGSLSIKGQTSTGSSGGDLILQSGEGSSLDGYLTLAISSRMLVHASEVTSGNYVLGLATNSVVTNTQMPVNSGNHVVYVKNALSNPSANPTSGAILYSSGASLHTRRGSGLNFEIGDAQSIKGIDVNILGIEDGYGLIYNSSSGDWEATLISGAFIAGGDLSGTSTSQTVIGIQGESVLATTPTNGQVLTYTGSAWAPASVGLFTAGNDLAGTLSSQDVIQVTGYDNGGEQQVDILVKNMLFDGYVDNVMFGQAIAQGAPVDGYGRNFTIFAQDGYRLGFDETYGGDLILHGGRNGNVGVPGSIRLQLAYWDPNYGGTETNIDVVEVGSTASYKSVISIFNNLVDIGRQPDSFFASTENVMFVSSGSLNSQDEPSDSSHCAVWYESGDLWFANNSNKVALTETTGTFTMTFGTDIGSVVSEDTTISGYTSDDDMFVRFTDPAAVPDGALIIGWKHVSTNDLRVYVSTLNAAIQNTGPHSFTYVLRKR